MHKKVVFDLLIVDKRPNICILEVKGKKALQLFEKEAGIHQIQRVPPTEKRGRVHTSIITIAVLPIPKETEVEINPNDIEFKTCRGSGAGGQHRNVTDSAVQLTHKPSGIMVRCESERSQHQNKDTAMSLLRARLLKEQKQKDHDQYKQIRQSQIAVANNIGRGSGKKRTLRFQEDLVIDHETNKKMTIKEYLKGMLDKIQ